MPVTRMHYRHRLQLPEGMPLQMQRNMPDEPGGGSAGIIQSLASRYERRYKDLDWVSKKSAITMVFCNRVFDVKYRVRSRERTYGAF